MTAERDPLVAFLRARIAEDVATAGAAGPTMVRVPQRTGRWQVDKDHPGSRFPPGFRLGDDAVFVDDGDEGMALVNGRPAAAHIARFDPERRCRPHLPVGGGYPVTITCSCGVPVGTAADKEELGRVLDFAKEVHDW